jgi:hypothetical protein
MGHYAILHSSVCSEPHRAKEGGQPELYLMAKYCLPIFWVALFRPENMHQFACDDLDGETWPYLLGRREDCVAQLLKRRTNLFSVLPQMHLPVYESFIDVLQKVQQPYLHFESDDIAGLCGSEPPEWTSELLDAMAALDARPPERIRSGLAALFRGSGLGSGWEGLLLKNSIELAKPKPEDWYGLAGGYYSEMPWEPQE